MSPALVLSHALPKSDWIMIGGRLILNGKINYQLPKICGLNRIINNNEGLFLEKIYSPLKNI